MSSVFANLINTSENLKVFERGITTTQNNVANVSTPNFAKQRQAFSARRFEPEVGIMGGVENGSTVTSRSSFAEMSVWRQQHQFGMNSQRRGDLEAIEPVFDVAQNSGIAGSVNRLFKSFSQLSVSPNNSTTREEVLGAARGLAASFRETSKSLGASQARTDTQLRQVVAQINELGERMAAINTERRANFAAGRDAGSDSRLHQTLEELASLVDFTAVEGDDGTMSIFLGGQTLFAIGNRLYPISVEIPTDGALVRDSSGNDVSWQIKQGKLGGLLDYRNNTLPSYNTQLNTLAQSLADEVNGTLANGLTLTNDPPPSALFSYDANVGAASTLAVTDISTADIAAASATAPGGNGNAVALEALSRKQVLNGLTFTGYYGALAAHLGRDLESARQSESTAQTLLDQAESFRQQISGVSLDEEAAQLIQYQRAYQAVGQMFKTINELTETVVNLLR